MKKKIGIIGGAGPLASCQLYKEIIKEYQRYGCKNDNDFPEMVVINYPFSNMLTVQDCKNNQQALITELQACFNTLADQNIHVAAIACNTLHTLLNNVNTKVPIFINIAQAALDYAKKHDLKRLLILGTETTLTLRLYASDTIECLAPQMLDQLAINQIIKSILEGNMREIDAIKLTAIINTYKPLDGIVLACTELPLLINQYKKIVTTMLGKITILDTLEILAKQIVQKSSD